MQQRQQPLGALALGIVQDALDRQVELLDEVDLIIECIAEAHATLRIELARHEAEAPKRRRVECARRLPGVGGHRLRA